MFKRLLTCLIAGCLVFEAPVSVYAASPNADTAMGGSVEEEKETSEENNENISEDEMAPEETGESKEGETFTVESSETGGDLMEEVTSEEVLPEDDTEELPESMTEDSISAEESIEDTVSAETEESIDSETEESMDLEPESVPEEGVLEEQGVCIETASEEVPALKYGETNTVTIAADNGAFIKRWYSFTAPEDGYYNLHADRDYIVLGLGLDLGVVSANHLNFRNLYIGFMEEGETVYFYCTNGSSEDIVVNLTLQKPTVFEAVKQEERYCFDTEKYVFSVLPEMGYNTIRIQASIEAKEGKNIEDSYKIIAAYQRVDSGTGYGGAAILRLKSEQNYQDEHKSVVSSNSVYKLSFILQDEADNVLEVYDGNIVLQAKKTDEEIVIYDTAVTENSITFDMEAIVSKSYACYYAPVDGSEEEKCQYVYRGWDYFSITDLKPDTEYYFRFVNSYSAKTVFETRAATASTTTKAVYSIDTDENSGLPVLRADISGYTGSETEGWFWHEYTDALGKKQAAGLMIPLNASETGEDVGKTGTAEKKFAFVEDVLEAETSYDITVWVKIGELILQKETMEITTPKAPAAIRNLKFMLDQENGGVKYTVEADGIENDILYGKLYYRQQGMKGSYNSQRVSLSDENPQTMGNITGLQNGAAYDFVLLFNGVKKEMSVTVGTADIKLTQIDEGEINAFDIARTYRLESESELEENYSLTLFYWNNLYDAYSEILQASLNVGNEYQAEIKTASSGFIFEAGTDYELKWELKSDSEKVYTFCESIHTKNANISWEVIESNYRLRKYEVALDSRDVANFEDFSLNLGAYIKRLDSTNGYPVKADSVFLNSGSKYHWEVWFSGLEPNTTYEVFLQSVSGIEYGTNTFTTSADTRQINVTNINTAVHEATLNYLLTGDISAMSTYVLCYLKEKGAENAWERAGIQYYNNVNGDQKNQMNISSYNGAELKAGTTYEYQIGFGGSDNTELSKLDKTVTGEFSTKNPDTENPCTLAEVDISAYFTKAEVRAVLSGNVCNDDSYLHLFYRKKGTSDWIHESPQPISEDISYYNMIITGLKADTVYEYAVVIMDDYTCDNPNEAEQDDRKIQGEFSTKKSEYTLEFETDEAKTTDSKAVVQVAAKNSTKDEVVKVELTLNDHQKQTVLLRQSGDYKREVSFTGLTGNTEYTIIKAVLSVLENGSYTVIAELDCNYKFMTKEAKIPKTIVLSEKKITLNAAYTGEYFSGYHEGYNSKTLKATAVPAAAAADVIWSSSDETVATVENGRINAQGIGTAIVTAQSIYDPDVKSVCEITVKDCIVGYMEENILRTFDRYDTEYPIYKNDDVGGLGLYERDGKGNVTLLSGYAVTPVRSGIVSWGNGKLYALSSGVTDVIFEKDGYRAKIAVCVTAEGKGFGITAFTASRNKYPAVKEADGSFTLAYTQGITYMAEGEISPNQPFHPQDYKWSISDESIAEVSSEGVVTPKKAGTVKLKAVPLRYYTINDKPYKNKEAVITLHIKNLPAQNVYEPIYALANLNTRIGDVNFPESWGKGWSWKYPDTPLVVNGVYTDNCYSFEAVYDGTESYPDETTIPIFIGKITGAVTDEVIGNRGETAHNQVLEVGNGDALTLKVTPECQGRINADSYDVEIPSVNGLIITENADGSFNIKAQKKGSYTLKPIIREKSTKEVLAKTSYKIKAVAEKQAGSVILTSDTEGIIIDGNTVILEKAESRKEFTLNAVVKDRYGEALTTALTWKSTDKKVASVSKKGVHSAKVSVKGEGHTVITATAKDAAGISAEIKVEIQNHMPRVDTQKATVNLAYDYERSDGKQLAESAGAVEIIPVYGEMLTEVELRDQTGETALENLALEWYGGCRYLVRPSAQNLQTGTYNCTIYVKTNTDEAYSYPLKVTVTDKSPKVSVKTKAKVNLFYTYATGRIDVSISGGRKRNTGSVESVTWEEDSAEENNSFIVDNVYYDLAKKVDYISVSQQSGIKIANGNLLDTGVARGTLNIKLRGYKKIYKFENFVIGYEYKKPVLVTESPSSNIVPSMVSYKENQPQATFSIYDKTNKKYLYLGSQYNHNNDYYDEIYCDSDEVTLGHWLDATGVFSSVWYWYSGKEKTKKMNLTVDSPLWREPLTVSHIIKTIKPQAYLSSSGCLTFHPALESMGYIYVYLKNANDISLDESRLYTDIAVQGANAKSQKALDDNLLVITTSGNEIQVTQSQAELMGTAISTGTYSYKVTPYYTSQETGEKTALNTMTLKVKVTDKPTAVKVSPKGNLDLTYGTGDNNIDEKKNMVILADPKFINLASGYHIDTSDPSAYRLTGEYSEYFELSYGPIKYNGKYGYHYYITIKDGGNNDNICKLKAGQSYKLAIEYTLTNDNGGNFKVTSNTFTIKPKQTVAKVTVTNNNQTLYAGADNLSRNYYLSVPTYYSIESAYGSLDCNKDGRADITVSGADSLTVRITDKDAVGATVKGKSYSIPVTVRLKGRDGIGKDVKVSIQVKIKK